MNRCTLNNIFIFAVGAAIGSAVTWKLLKTKYEQIAQEEIDSVKEVFSRNAEEDTEEDTDEEPDEPRRSVTEKPSLAECAARVKDLGYVNYSNYKEEKKEVTESMADVDRPYVISPDEFGEFDDYEQISLTLYADGVLTDDYDEPLEDVEGTVGEDSLTHFGEYEDDSVFVRNDRLKADYEILKDLSNYSDIKER